MTTMLIGTGRRTCQVDKDIIAKCLPGGEGARCRSQKRRNCKRWHPSHPQAPVWNWNRISDNAEFVILLMANFRWPSKIIIIIITSHALFWLTRPPPGRRPAILRAPRDPTHVSHAPGQTNGQADGRYRLALIRVQRPTPAMFFCDSLPWPLTFWLQNKWVPGLIEENFCVKFGDISCIWFWATVRKKNEQTHRQTEVETVYPILDSEFQTAAWLTQWAFADRVNSVNANTKVLIGRS